MPPLHTVLAPLEELLGTWVGEGTGQLPDGAPFSWHERFDIGHGGGPALAFRQRTTRPEGGPFHAEDGWVRVPPELQREDGSGRSVEVAVASPTGVMEALSGTVGRADAGALQLDASSTSVIGTPAAATVHATRRRWTLSGPDTLVVEFWMATPTYPALFHHLTAELHRQPPTRQDPT